MEKEILKVDYSGMGIKSLQRIGLIFNIIAILMLVGAFVDWIHWVDTDEWFVPIVPILFGILMLFFFGCLARTIAGIAITSLYKKTVLMARYCLKDVSSKEEVVEK